MAELAAATFNDYFLGDKEQDSLAWILSFLTCRDLGRLAMTCQRLTNTVMIGDEGNVNAIWKGAEAGLTKNTSCKHNFCHAREYCRFFVAAAKHATECEASEEPPKNRMAVDGVMANFLNIRGETLAAEEEEEVINCRDQLDEENRIREEMMREEEPRKEYYHEVFIRIRRFQTKEIIGQGFCSYEQQPALWYEPLGNHSLELSLSGTILGFEDSREYQSFRDSFSAEGDTLMRGEILQSKFHFSVIAIDKRNPDSAQCIFQTGDDYYYVGGDSLSRHTRFGPPHYLFQYPLKPKWDSETVQLGSVLSRWYLTFGVGTYVQSLEHGGVCRPVLILKIREEVDGFIAAISNEYSRPRVAEDDKCQLQCSIT